VVGPRWEAGRGVSRASGAFGWLIAFRFGGEVTLPELGPATQHSGDSFWAFWKGEGGQMVFFGGRGGGWVLFACLYKYSRVLLVFAVFYSSFI
jgi:hypothetical protein